MSQKKQLKQIVEIMLKNQMILAKSENWYWVNDLHHSDPDTLTDYSILKAKILNFCSDLCPNNGQKFSFVIKVKEYHYCFDICHFPYNGKDNIKFQCSPVIMEDDLEQFVK